MGSTGTQTEQRLKDASANESQANRRYLHFASKAGIEGRNDAAALLRSTAEGETGHAHGHLECLEAIGDPITGLPIGDSRQNLESAVASETQEYDDRYPGMARIAREEGFDEIADGFETLAKAERSHADRHIKALAAPIDRRPGLHAAHQPRQPADARTVPRQRKAGLPRMIEHRRLRTVCDLR